MDSGASVLFVSNCQRVFVPCAGCLAIFKGSLVFAITLTFMNSNAIGFVA
jgi:hypothetical protein